MAKRRGRRVKNKKKSPILWIALGVLSVLLIVAIYFAVTMYQEYSSKGVGTGDAVEIEIAQGETTRDIAGKLKEKGLIKYESMFYLKARSMNAGSKLRYGTFTIYEGSGMEDIINALISGGAKKEETMFTVPEGYTIEQIAQKLEAGGICTESEFLEAVEKNYDYWFLESIPEDADVFYRLQGFLYPETYAIGEDMTAEDIVVVMLEQFGKVYTQDMDAKAKSLGKTTYEVVIEASLIERETGIESEKATIAGVIKNRLEQGMLLQIDPTFLYPLTNGLYDITDVKRSHTEYESPYNTYQNSGLPPGPIANPSISALEAALNPEEHDYFYYHTDNDKNDGSHIFSKTYEEHVNTL